MQNQTQGSMAIRPGIKLSQFYIENVIVAQVKYILELIVGIYKGWVELPSIN